MNVEVNESLTAEYEQLLVRELRSAWHTINRNYFRSQLRLPVMGLTDSSEVLGRWDRTHRSIVMSRPFVLGSSWGAVLEVLKHEVAHQYVHEVLGAIDETPHGPAFRGVCERMGVDATATGVPAVVDGPEEEQKRKLLKRVADLLALAQSNNRHEAENAAAAAQKLMLKHNIALCDEPGRRRYGFRQLGRPQGRVQEAEHILAGILADHFFVEAIWVSGYRPTDGKRGNLLEICGTPENLEIAGYVYDFLKATAERLWAEHKRAHGIEGNRDRRTYIAGVMEGFNERLGQERRRSKERGLVWVGDADLEGYYRARHPYIRNVRLRGHALSQARMHGRSAGRDIVLHKGVRGASDGGGPRLLPPKR